jgi:hypothetical protein
MNSNSEAMTSVRLKGLSLVPALFSAAVLAIGCERPPQGASDASTMQAPARRLIESRNPPQTPVQPLPATPANMRRLESRTLIAALPPSTGNLPAAGILQG